MRARLQRVAIDVEPLRASRDFRLLWLGGLVSDTGTQVTLVAVLVQVFALTGSAAAVGLVGLVQLVPLALASLLGGPFIDRHDRRRLLLLGQVGEAAGSAVLLAGALVGHPPLALVYAGAALIGGFGGFSDSVRSSMTPNLVPDGLLPSALSLNQVMFHTSLIVGPAIGGLVIGAVGLAWAYGIDVVTFGATIGAALLMRPQVRAAPVSTPGVGALRNGWQQVTEGFRFLRGRRVLQSTFYVDLVAMVFGMPRALFPVLAVTSFGGGAGTVGILFSAVSVGGLLGALTTGWVRHVRRQGAAVLWAVSVWGAGIVVFGLSDGRLAIALVALAVAGAADVVSAVFRGTILQQSVPDELRGRISGVHILVVTGGPRVGDAEAGLVASAFTPTVSVVAGGAACIVGVGVLALLVPELGRYRAPPG